MLPSRTPKDWHTRMNAITLPDNTRLIANDKVWMEGEALDQLARVARFPGCVCAVGQPDLHPGAGIPLGASFAFQDAVHPHLVGSDAGCGVRVFAVPKVKALGDQLERRVMAATDEEPLPDLDPMALLDAAWQKGPRGLASVPGIPDGLASLAEVDPEDDGPFSAIPSSPTPDLPGAIGALGTIGGGNHFLELSRVATVIDRLEAARSGLTRGEFAVVAHSGSRGLGKMLSSKWGNEVLTGERLQLYLQELAGTVRFARSNRLVLAWRMLNAIGAGRAERVGGTFDVTHNTVVPGVFSGQPIWLHRKGAAPAEEGQTTIVLGSRGAPSWVMVGSGREDALWSVAHGAGRRLGRNEAVGKLKPRYTRASLLRTELGGRVLCDDTELLYAEHPDCYKDIEPVVESLEQAGVARRVAALHPVITVKR